MNVKSGLNIIFSYLFLFLIVGNSVYSIEGKSGNYTLIIENVKGIDFVDNTEDSMNYSAISILIIIFLIFIYRIIKLRQGKR